MSDRIRAPQGPDDDGLELVDAADLLQVPPPPIEWAVEGVLPRKSVGDLYAMGGTGKTTLLTRLELDVASEAGTFFGRKCFGGPVVVLGDEHTDRAALARDLHRLAQGRRLAQGQLIFPRQRQASVSPLWAWDAANAVWQLTTWGEHLTRWLTAIQPVLISIDTLVSVVQAANILDHTQQYGLATALQQWAHRLGDPVVLTVTHTNQASAQQGLSSRLSYLSRLGSGGVPSRLRWAMGMTRLLPEDDLARKLGLKERAARDSLLAVAVSKGNEMPRPAWAVENPAILEIRPDGALDLVHEGLGDSRPKRAAANDEAAGGQALAGGGHGWWEA